MPPRVKAVVKADDGTESEAEFSDCSDEIQSLLATVAQRGSASRLADTDGLLVRLHSVLRAGYVHSPQVVELVVAELASILDLCAAGEEGASAGHAVMISHRAFIATETLSRVLQLFYRVHEVSAAAALLHSDAAVRAFASVVQVMKGLRADTKVQLEGCKIMHDMLAVRHLALAASSDGVSSLLEALQAHSGDEDVSKVCLESLALIAANSSAGRQQAVEAGILATLMACMASHAGSERVLTQALALMSALATSVPDLLVDTQAVAAVLSAMRTHTTAELVQVRGCKLLVCFLSKTTATAAALASAGALEGVLSSLRTFPTASAVQVAGLHALAHFAHVAGPALLGDAGALTVVLAATRMRYDALVSLEVHTSAVVALGLLLDKTEEGKMLGSVPEMAEALLDMMEFHAGLVAQSGAAPSRALTALHAHAGVALAVLLRHPDALSSIAPERALLVFTGAVKRQLDSNLELTTEELESFLNLAIALLSRKTISSKAPAMTDAVELLVSVTVRIISQLCASTATEPLSKALLRQAASTCSLLAGLIEPRPDCFATAIKQDALASVVSALTVFCDSPKVVAYLATFLKHAFKDLDLSTLPDDQLHLTSLITALTRILAKEATKLDVALTCVEALHVVCHKCPKAVKSSDFAPSYSVGIYETLTALLRRHESDAPMQVFGWKALCSAATLFFSTPGAAVFEEAVAALNRSKKIPAVQGEVCATLMIFGSLQDFKGKLDVNAPVIYVPSVIKALLGIIKTATTESVLKNACEALRSLFKANPQYCTDAAKERGAIEALLQVLGPAAFLKAPDAIAAGFAVLLSLLERCEPSRRAAVSGSVMTVVKGRDDSSCRGICRLLTGRSGVCEDGYLKVKMYAEASEAEKQEQQARADAAMAELMAEESEGKKKKKKKPAKKPTAVSPPASGSDATYTADAVVAAEAAEELLAAPAASEAKLQEVNERSRRRAAKALAAAEVPTAPSAATDERDAAAPPVLPVPAITRFADASLPPAIDDDDEDDRLTTLSLGVDRSFFSPPVAGPAVRHALLSAETTPGEDSSADEERRGESEASSSSQPAAGAREEEAGEPALPGDEVTRLVERLLLPSSGVSMWQHSETLLVVFATDRAAAAQLASDGAYKPVAARLFRDEPGLNTAPDAL